jgi:hypothetical protein
MAFIRIGNIMDDGAEYDVTVHLNGLAYHRYEYALTPELAQKKVEASFEVRPYQQHVGNVRATGKRRINGFVTRPR